VRGVWDAAKSAPANRRPKRGFLQRAPGLDTQTRAGGGREAKVEAAAEAEAEAEVEANWL
jgi:hypothetical protein